MSSKNNKPANNPVDKEKKPQTPPTSNVDKSSSKAIDERKTTEKNAVQDSKAEPTNNTPLNSANNSKSEPKNAGLNTKQSAPSTKVDKVGDKANDTLAKPVPPVAKPTSNNAKPVPTPASSASDTTSSKKNADKPASNKTNVKTGGDKGNGTTPPPNKPHTPKQSPLPLIISLIALGLGGYALYNSTQKPQFNPEEVQKLQAEITALQKEIAEQSGAQDIASLRENMTNLEKQVSDINAKPGVSGGLDEAQIQSLVAQQVDQARQSLQESLTVQAQPGLSKEQVNTMIKEALVSNASNSDNAQPTIDFSSEIDAIKQDKADIEQYLEQIRQQGESLKTSLNESAEQAKNSLNESASQLEKKITAADQQPIVYPLINALSLAEIASNAHQYGVASQYLQQAKSSFDDLHLNQPPYAEFAKQIDELEQKTARLAKNQNSQQAMESIISSVSEWPFISTDPENMLDNNPSNKPTESWKDDIKAIGNKILSSTVTITKNDAAGLTWINENPHLQQIIRENVRLDLAMIRNALLIGDQERAQQIAATLRDQVNRYFDTDAEVVKQALSQLDELTQQQSEAPDIAPLIQSIQQAG